MSAGILIHAPREGSDDPDLATGRRGIHISIHAPREGSDPLRPAAGRKSLHFYPRSPRGERQKSWPGRWSNLKFLSTLPARGATRRVNVLRRVDHISIHAPREGSDCALSTLDLQNGDFYPRSPRGERLFHPKFTPPDKVFLSTLPARGATARRSAPPCGWSHFYPRSPRGERHAPPASGPRHRDFYPRSPRGERRPNPRHSYCLRAFLSTLPARGATPCRTLLRPCLVFLSTLPARGATITEGVTYGRTL